MGWGFWIFFPLPWGEGGERSEPGEGSWFVGLRLSLAVIMVGPGAIQHQPKPSLEERVVRAAEAALAVQNYVSPIDILTGIGLLAPSNVGAWRKELINYLREMIQGSPEKISRSLSIFRDWALKRGLQPQEVPYFARTIGQPRELRFTAEGRREEESVYRTHYLSPELPAKKQEKLKERLDVAA